MHRAHRASLILSATALAVAVLGTTPLGQAAGNRRALTGGERADAGRQRVERDRDTVGRERRRRRLRDLRLRELRQER